MTHKIYLAAVLCVVAACATEPDPLNRTQPEAIPKAIFDGEWYYTLTVTDADWENRFTFIGEETATYMGKSFKVRWEIAQERLNAYMVPQVYRDEQGNPVQNPIGQKSLILSFRIKKHYDIRYRYNSTTREDLNVIEENTDRPWNEREYMEVDWSRSLATNIWNPTSQDVATGQLQREDVAEYENVEFFARGPDRDHDILIDTRKWDPEDDPEVYAINIDTKESVTTKLLYWWQLYYGRYMEPTTIRFRHSLLKAPPADQQTYAPMQYRDELFRRFGYFRTEYEVWDPERHVPVESAKKYFINRWDLSGDKQITWYLSPHFQEAVDAGDTKLKEWAQQVCDAWDKTLREATGRNDQIVVLKENEPLLDDDGQQIRRADGTKRWKYELGDMRYSFINMTFNQNVSQPLGYGPSSPDADTGQILRANVNIYAGWVEWVVQRALDQFDVASGLCTVQDVMAGRHFDPGAGKCNGGDASEPVNGPVSATGRVNGSTPPGGTTGAKVRFLSPALLSSYWPSPRMAEIDRQELLQDLQRAKPQLEQLYRQELTHPVVLDLNGFSTVAGTAYEPMLLPQGNLTSLMPYADDINDPEVLAQLSPAQRLNPARMQALKVQMIQQMALRDEPVMFEPAIHAFVQEMKGKPRDEVEQRLRRWIYYTTTLHEMGHTLGLRHNFAASADRRNFPPEFEQAYNGYWDNIDNLRKQYQARINNGEAQALTEYSQKVDDLPSIHQRFASSSIMDYQGDWMDWTQPVRSYDRAALLLGYGSKVEVKQGNGWQVVAYQEGDFTQEDPLNETQNAKSGRNVRYYLFCSDEKTFDDAFCTPFDRGVTATEIVRNFIQTAHHNYIFMNFKRDRTSFEGFRNRYYMYKWIRQYYMYAKPFAQMTLNSIRYDEFWGSVFDGINAMVQGPEMRNMKPGYHRDGGEDLLRASLLFYYYLLFDVLMRPDYGSYQLKHDTSGEPFWESVKERYLDDSLPSAFIDPGAGWGYTDWYDIQQDHQRYEVFLRRIGVELDKVIALEVLSIPMALNTPLAYEKANGNSFWSSLWTNNGLQLWEVARGLITDNFSHLQNPWCMYCDAACRADPAQHPPHLRSYAVDYLEGLGSSGIFSKYPLPTGKNRCGGPDEQPVQPGIDALFAIKPIFYAISGAAHPWYHNAVSEHLDSQVKGGNHRFDIPPNAEFAQFENASGTKTYQAVQTEDGMSISYTLVDNGRRIRNRLELAVACLDNQDTTGLTGTLGTHDRNCTEIKQCYANADSKPAWCDSEGWSSGFALPAVRYRDLDRIEAMLIMMQDMIDIAGHYAWRVPGYLSEY